jgi:SAM-dependent methyltransferase
MSITSALEDREMSRPELIERATYTPALPVEEFMVPLLLSRIAPILESLPATAGRVLDVGCGRQPFRSLFEARGYAYVSTDAQNPLGIVDVVAEIDKDLPPALLARGPFDFILCTEVLEHVADWHKVFANFGVLLKSGARLLITCPHFYILHEVPYDFWRPTTYALLYHSEKFGLRCVSIEAAGGSWEILGTILGANLDSARAVERTLFNRMLGFTVDGLTRTMFHVLKSRFFQRRVAWGSDRYPLYLSNVALFEKSI